MTTNAWEERKKALENQYFYKKELELIEKMKKEHREELIRGLCRNRCPKCGVEIVAMEFREVPLDKCRITSYNVCYTKLLRFVEEGVASWYGEDFHGKLTSNGEVYDMYAMTAAHKTLPLGVYVRVTNKQNGQSAVVRVNDRGPFVDTRIIDLSYAAAKQLGVVGPGTA